MRPFERIDSPGPAQDVGLDLFKSPALRFHARFLYLTCPAAGDCIAALKKRSSMN
jgi:hypothetical protein